jgi:hypothetical protein
MIASQAYVEDGSLAIGCMSRDVVLLCYDDGRPDLKIDYRRTL